jgi:hypothetical protein
MLKFKISGLKAQIYLHDIQIATTFVRKAIHRKKTDLSKNNFGKNRYL